MKKSGTFFGGQPPRTPHAGLTFSTALIELKAGRSIYRGGWNGKGMYLRLQVPDGGSKMTLPYIYMHTAQGHVVPWVASQTDLLSQDWALVGF